MDRTKPKIKIDFSKIKLDDLEHIIDIDDLPF